MKSLLIISSYPKKRSVHGKETAGVASYTKNTLLAIKTIEPEKTEITVMAEKLNDDGNYAHQGINVVRLWNKDSFSIFPTILKNVLRNYKNAQTIIVEFELFMFGNPLHLAPFLAFILTLRLLRKKIIIVNHQVVPTLNAIGPYINVEDHTLKSVLLSLGLRLFYFLMLLISNKTIVFEEGLKQKLSLLGSSKKITVIPHGVENFTTNITKTNARKRLGIKKEEFVVVSFGYLAWYKGTDWLVHTISELKNSKKTLGKNIKLILAGGPNPNYENKDYYTKYLNSITKEAEKNGITITGFVPQGNIALYYNAADVIVLPYRTYMGSSGPLSMAFAFKKPFLLANPLSNVLHQKDMKELLEQYHLDEANIIFKESPDLTTLLEKIWKNTNFRRKLTKLSADLAKKRDWKLIGKDYYEEIFT